MSEIRNKLHILYENPKSRGFINHLIHAYMPANKPKKVFNFDDKKNVHKCCLCDHELIDLETMFQGSQSKEFMNDTIKHMKRVINQEETPREEIPIIKHVTHGAIMAWTGENTTTYMCEECIKEFFDFITNMLFRDDKNITYQLNKNRRNYVFDTFKNSSNLNNEEKKEVEKIQKKIEVNKKHVTTLGDLKVLQDLAEKMKNE